MKRNIVYVLLIALSFGCVSCDNYWNNWRRSRAKIDKLLAERRFEEAREVANKISGGGLSGEDEKLKAELLKEISLTQLNFLLEDGEYEIASALAHELRMEDLFYDVFFKNIRQIVKSGNYDFVFETIMDWQCPCDAQLCERNLLKNFNYLLEERKPNHRRSNGTYNPCIGGRYNWFIRPVNNAVDVVMQKVMYEGNPTNIRRCLMCYKPYSVFDRKVRTDETNNMVKEGDKYWYDFYFKLQNTAKEDAEKMLREAKIKY